MKQMALVVEETYYLKSGGRKKFLGQFFKHASGGKIPTITQIKLAYEQKVGKKVNKTTIYRLLNRHEWSKIVPRLRHLKYQESEQ